MEDVILGHRNINMTVIYEGSLSLTNIINLLFDTYQYIVLWESRST